jgi:hypothetical protein
MIIHTGDNIFAHSPLWSGTTYSTVSEAFASLLFENILFEYRQKKPL